MPHSIFIVEDEASLRDVLARHLRQRGHDVIASEDAESALRHLLEAPPFDLLITDIHLPSLSVSTCCASSRRTRPRGRCW